MSEIPPKYTVTSVFLKPIRKILLDNLIDPARLLAKYHIPANALQQDDMEINHYNFANVLNETARLSGDDLVGFLMGKEFDLSNCGLAGVLISKQSMLFNIYPIINYIFNAQNRGAKHKLKVTTSHAYHYMDFLIDDVVDCDQIALLTLAGYHNAFRQLLGESWQLQKVLIRNPKVIDISRLQQYFNCPILLGQDMDALVFSPNLIYQDSSLVTFTSDRKLKMEIAAILHEFDDIDGLVIKYIEYLMPAGKANKAEVAKSLGVHARVLQNCLQERGLSFKSLLTQTRQTQAKKLLTETNLTIDDIAYALGYSSIGIFSRAFVSWMGCSPLKWRKQSKANN
ncbi:AraC family transcriptional regulator ligand-binding domain-containing protein [Thalassotalea psychrophila]|uniref:AraC family transcriptional regulator ligand-binding domain-containing protein n=1 Tax=Thalassotalea psychrophila TaxID=3065647 RepID=A0ABY9U094_9GAMM|nr:AraC family transcriptional regulator ligand-binding domain-containing protein [Colwelliaceae bacterium SQ149]